MNNTEKYLAARKVLRDFVVWEKTHKNDPFVNWDSLTGAIDTVLDSNVVAVQTPTPVALHRTGVPMNAEDWTEADWRDLHEAIQSTIAKVAARHKPS